MNVQQFYSFLHNYKVRGEGVYCTHTSCGAPWGKYDIPIDKTDEFMNLYCESLGSPLHIVEMPCDIGPLMLDIDYYTNVTERQYTQNNIKDLIIATNKIISEHYVISGNMLESYVTEKPKLSVTRNKFKDGFHITYPYLAASFGMKYLILYKLMLHAVDTNMFNNIKSINETKDYFDMNVVKNNGFIMYGSKKSDGQLYTLSKIYDGNMIEIDTGIFESADLVKILSNRKFEYCNESILVNDYSDEIDKVMNKYDNNYIKLKKQMVKITLAKKLVNIMSVERATNYDTWINVCCALRNVSPKLLNTFKEFSMKAGDMYNEASCINAWNESNNDEHTLSSLKCWAKMDNYEKFVELFHD